jgi:hypothetical protein
MNKIDILFKNLDLRCRFYNGDDNCRFYEGYSYTVCNGHIGYCEIETIEKTRINNE